LKYSFLKKHLAVVVLGLMVSSCYEPVEIENAENSQTSTAVNSETITQTQSNTNTEALTGTSSQTDTNLGTQTQTQVNEIIGDAIQGANLFKSLNCALCHGDNLLGSKPLDGYDALDKNKTQYSHSITPNDIQSFVEYTSDWMPRSGVCDLQCATDIEAYLNTWLSN